MGEVKTVSRKEIYISDLEMKNIELIVHPEWKEDRDTRNTNPFKVIQETVKKDLIKTLRDNKKVISKVLKMRIGLKTKIFEDGNALNPEYYKHNKSVLVKLLGKAIPHRLPGMTESLYQLLLNSMYFRIIDILDIKEKPEPIEGDTYILKYIYLNMYTLIREGLDD